MNHTRQYHYAVLDLDTGEFVDVNGRRLFTSAAAFQARDLYRDFKPGCNAIVVECHEVTPTIKVPVVDAADWAPGMIPWAEIEPPADPTGIDCFERHEGIEP